MIRAALLHAAAVAADHFGHGADALAHIATRTGTHLLVIHDQLTVAARSAERAIPRHADHRGAGSAITADIHRRTP